ncbi:MAG: UDP-N-acetylmuramoyl-L-alanyl-D-glutamate--2,6-diaminopimelate ligase [Patescibacteria group bacterium]
MIKLFIKKLIPKKLILLYHYLIARCAAIWYGFPARNMIIIGITGTKGKTSTANFIWGVLTAGGYKTGVITTANIRIGEDEILNTYHMTMPGRFTVQKLLRQMLKENCTHCVIETTSEGIQQHRSVGVYYDIAVFTNLSPEHLEAHGGSFEEYKTMKGRMFAALSEHPRKVLAGKTIETAIIANDDSQHSSYYLNFPSDKKITYGLHEGAGYQAEQILENSEGVVFEVGGRAFRTYILGSFNVYNALPAIVIGDLVNIDDNLIARGLASIKKIPGRMEIIDEGQDFKVIVDYAHEQQSIVHVLQAAHKLKKTPDAKIVILLGAEGGGRDKAKRPLMGEFAARLADYVVVSNVDPYNDDPKQILEDIAVVAEKFDKSRNENLFVIEDRREGIRKALSLAKTGGVVLITGKGAEQSMIIGRKNIPWDDRTVVREELRRLFQQTH